MLTKEQSLYQVKLILDYLPEEEYKLIPKETIDYIEENFQYDENIVIDPNTPLENQNIDDSTYEMLDKIIQQTESVKNEKGDLEPEMQTQSFSSSELEELAHDINKSNEDLSEEIEKIKLSNLVDSLKEENEKIPKIKELVVEYKEALKQKDEEIKTLQENNEILYTNIQKIPRFIRRFFIKEDDIKLLGSGKE